MYIPASETGCGEDIIIGGWLTPLGVSKSGASDGRAGGPILNEFSSQGSYAIEHISGIIKRDLTSIFMSKTAKSASEATT